MSDPWIKMRTNLKDAPEVLAMAVAMNQKIPTIIGCFQIMWSWFDTYTTKKRSNQITLEMIDKMVDVEGFAAAAVRVFWLGKEGDELFLPNPERHNGETAKSRAMVNARVSKHRSRNGDSVTQALHERYKCNGDSVTSALPDKIREEEIREEVSHVSAETVTTDVTDTDFSKVQAVLERRLARQLGSFDLGKLADLRERIRTTPVEVDGVVQSWGTVAIRAMEVMPGNVGSWPTYVGTTIENIRQRGAWPVQRAEVAPTAEALVTACQRCITFNGTTIAKSDLGTNSGNIVQKSTRTVFVPKDRIREAQVDRG